MPKRGKLNIHPQQGSVKHQCFGCQNRHPGCHGQCESYKAYAASREDIYEYRRIVHLIRDARNDGFSRTCSKPERHHGLSTDDG